ncbi:hypothetical protein [Aquimarina longa]|uniref:hypothetical protein n=1 Tax=Aquimarina longa TaxID=1080221 RepID=UPI000783D54B|nr:hypothetical protein [Aquimarina longa]
MLGNVILQITSPNQDTFNLEIQIEKNHNRIEYIQIFHTINEKVIDKRGTDSNIIYTSEKTKFKTIEFNTIKTSLEYPTTFHPSNFELKNAQIFWKAHVAIEFDNNTNYEIKEKFIVKNS